MKIAWAGKPGYLIINKADFDPEQHSVYGKESGLELSNSDRQSRQAELEGMDWREIKPIAESHGIEKPEAGWDEAIPLILDAEFGGNDG